MSVTIWQENEVFTARIYKRLAQRQDLVWANTYELNVIGSGVGNNEAAAKDVVNLLAEWEAGFHLEGVQFDRGVLSTWVPDGEPYDPFSFVSEPLTAVLGTRPIGSDRSPLQVCLLVRREVTSGRTGRALYRGVIEEADTLAVSGDPVLLPARQLVLQQLLNRPLPAAGDVALIEALNSLGVDPVMVGETGGIVRKRSVLGFSAAGVSVKPYNNRYFDRKPKAPPTP